MGFLSIVCVVVALYHLGIKLMDEEFPMYDVLKRPKVMRAKRFLEAEEYPPHVFQGVGGYFLKHHNGTMDRIRDGEWVLYLYNAEMEIISNFNFQSQYEITDG